YTDIVPELLAFGANPFLLAADLCLALNQTVQAVMTFQAGKKGRQELLASIEQRLATTEHNQMIAGSEDRGQCVDAEARRALAFGEDPQELVDDYRRFFKLFGQFLT